MSAFSDVFPAGLTYEQTHHEPGRRGSSSSVGCEGLSLAYRVWDLFILAILAILAILLRFPTALGCIVG